MHLQAWTNNEMKRLIAILFALSPVCWASGQVVAVESALLQDFSVVPGERYSGQVTLANRSGERASIVLYLNDYYRPRPGDIEFSEPGSAPHPRSNLSWIALGEPVVQLGPYERRAVAFSIAVPFGDPRLETGGTFWSALMVESLESQRRREAAESQTQSGVSLASSYRTAILLTTTIQTLDTPALSFLDVSTRRTRQGNLLVVDLRNESRSSIRNGHMWVELYDRHGQRRGEVSFDSLEVMLPGNAYRRQVLLEPQDFGRDVYRCVIVVDAGPDSLFGTQTTVDLTTQP